MSETPTCFFFMPSFQSALAGLLALIIFFSPPPFFPCPNRCHILLEPSKNKCIWLPSLLKKERERVKKSHGDFPIKSLLFQFTCSTHVGGIDRRDRTGIYTWLKVPIYPCEHSSFKVRILRAFQFIFKWDYIQLYFNSRSSSSTWCTSTMVRSPRT